jgi:AcrR family transcriptional regulator
MKPTIPPGLNPRKTPRQARSALTVEAVFEATIQVLLTEGMARLTTTRVAERAGVSVGTMYQYFPHKQALLFAVLQKHLSALADTLESTAIRHQGETIDAMTAGLVTAYVNAKTANVEASLALYRVASELDTAAFLAGISKRNEVATIAMLASASDGAFEDLPGVAFTLLTAMAGVTRATFERGATGPMLRTLRVQLLLMARSYLRNWVR